MTVVSISDAPKASKQEKLELYCQGLADGKSREQAYIDAGYSPNGARANVAVYHRTNHEYITAWLADHIGKHAPSALAVIVTIMNDPAEKGGIRLKAAQDVLDRSGFSAKQKIEVSHKNVDEMSTDELESEIAKLLSEDPKLAGLFSKKGS